MCFDINYTAGKFPFIRILILLFRKINKFKIRIYKHVKYKSSGNVGECMEQNEIKANILFQKIYMQINSQEDIL